MGTVLKEKFKSNFTFFFAYASHNEIQKDLLLSLLHLKPIKCLPREETTFLRRFRTLYEHYQQFKLPNSLWAHLLNLLFFK
jgi:hypothetical protein